MSMVTDSEPQGTGERATSQTHTEINDRIVDRIARQAALSVPGVVADSSGMNKLPGRGLPRFDIDRATADSAIYITAHIAVQWPCPVVAVAQTARETIAEWLEHYTGVAVLAINVEVEEVVGAEDGEVYTDNATAATAEAHGPQEGYALRAGRTQRTTLEELAAAPRTPELHYIIANPLQAHSPTVEAHLGEEDILRPQPMADVDVRSIAVPAEKEVRSIAAPAEPDVRSISAPEPREIMRPVEPEPVTPISISAPHPTPVRRIGRLPEPQLRRIPTPEPPAVSRVRTPATRPVYVPKVPENVGLRRIPTPVGLPLLADIPTPQGLPMRDVTTPEGLAVTVFPRSRREELTPVYVRQHAAITPTVPAAERGPVQVRVVPSAQRAELERMLVAGSALRAERGAHDEGGHL
ncbi:Asp23/Gls24 family envelope stress response protein [Corynebacterium heidelbergense]|uniref:Asp23/Gls24 family protein n=1 Tax=Corynebacterium heidelbergense TaxID=2055947 RepID=A0A364V880_9CORY|nr:Asp23/Gls24 family envelope stress response protein [Corynebacterium heidelbergense]RAV32814.1 hypothetical protein DLJ54_01540 [Corynebacterium heidelbergense]